MYFVILQKKSMSYCNRCLEKNSKIIILDPKSGGSAVRPMDLMLQSWTLHWRVRWVNCSLWELTIAIVERKSWWKIRLARRECTLSHRNRQSTRRVLQVGSLWTPYGISRAFWRVPKLKFWLKSGIFALFSVQRETYWGTRLPEIDQTINEKVELEMPNGPETPATRRARAWSKLTAYEHRRTALKAPTGPQNRNLG